MAVWPPEEVLDLIGGLARPEVEGLRWTTRDQWHVTLRFFGEAKLEDALGALRRVSAESTVAEMGLPGYEGILWIAIAFSGMTHTSKVLATDFYLTPKVPIAADLREMWPAIVERHNGFAVTSKPTNELAEISRKVGIPPELQGCHTAFIGDYVVDGHVPVEAIRSWRARNPAPARSRHREGSQMSQGRTSSITNMTAVETVWKRPGIWCA